MFLKIIAIILPGQLAFFQWLENYLVPCPFKYITGIDCPGCGFQRSVLALLKGDIGTSMALYPPSIPIILTFIFLYAEKRFNLDNKQFIVKKTIYVIVSLIIVFSYALKMWRLYHYNISA